MSTNESIQSSLRPREQRLSSLSADRRRLVLLMARMGFGEIRGLRVRGGEPQFEPAPEVVQEIKFGTKTSWAPPTADYTLKLQVLDLLEHLTSIRNGTVEALEVQAGLPFRMRLSGALHVGKPEDQGAAAAKTRGNDR